jgi:hypothetical protein
MYQVGKYGCLFWLLLTACATEPTVMPTEAAADAGSVDTNSRTPSGDTDSAPDADLLPESDVPQGSDTTATTPGDIEEPKVDPFSPVVVDDGGLTNIAWTLEKLLEQGSLDGACDAYKANPMDRELMLKCGKWMFFYESFGTAGVPRTLVDILLANFPAELGPAFSSLGLLPDPFSEDGYPLGMADDGAEGLAFTCASCHMGQLPDGRYAVGAPNHDYEYGRHNLILVAFPALAGGELTQKIIPEVKETLQPMLDHYNDELDVQLQLWGWMMSMLGQEIPSFTEESQLAYSEWEPGTMDFFIEPLPIDDGVHTVSKIAALWGVPTQAEVEASGMAHAMLGATGNTLSLNNFVRQFAGLGGGDINAWGPSDVVPLVAYIESLAPPAREEQPGAEHGETVFRTEGCIDCHSGPRGSGHRLYDFAEVGTDDALARWMDPAGDLSGLPGVDMGPDTVTGAIKSPRLVGLWAMDRYLHNGSVRSLEELLCITPRPASQPSPYSNQGHTFGCDTLSYEDKMALIDYLMSH